MTKLTIYAGNTTEIRLPGLQNADTLDYITGANITATLYTPVGNVVSGANALVMSDVVGEPGTVNCYLPSYLPLTEGSYYIV